MKKLLAILILILFTLQTPSQADDIQDFEIERVTIGDSLLDYMSEEEIKESVVSVYPDKKFTISVYKKSTEIYDSGVGSTYKSKDKKYKIHGVQGRISFRNIEDCYRKQDEVEKEISSMFNEIKKEDWGILKLNLQGTAVEGSTYKPSTFTFNTGEVIQIACYYYYDDPPHFLKISMVSKELNEYLISEIIIKPVEENNSKSEIKKLISKIKIEGFENVAKNLSISETATKGGDLGWLNENVISKKYRSKIAETPVGNISEPIFLPEGILIFKVREKRKIARNYVTMTSFSLKSMISSNFKLTLSDSSRKLI